jgi:hypothetical protein
MCDEMNQQFTQIMSIISQNPEQAQVKSTMLVEKTIK